MANKVYKRDGTVEAYNRYKVIAAVEACGASTDAGIEIADFIGSAAEEMNLTIDFIQKTVIKTLREDFDAGWAEAYESYANMRTEAREKSHKLMDKVMGILEQTDKEALHENANKASEQIPVMMNLISETVLRHHFEKNILPQHLKEAHTIGDIYIHDSGMIGLPITNCNIIDVAGMLRNGFRMGSVDIESAKGLRTAANVLIQVVQVCSSFCFGGQTVPDIDEILEPYAAMSLEKHKAVGMEFLEPWVERAYLDIKVEEYAKSMLLREIKDAAQLLEFQINTLMNSGGQQPFVTFTFGKGTSWLAREIQKAILNQRLEGIGKNKATPVFPKLVFWHKEGLNVEKDSPNYDIKQLAVKCSASRMFPDHLSVDRLTEFTGGAPSPMGM